MLRSMYSGISGLKNFQTKLDVIGNNISNVNTYGFKKSRVVFKDMINQNLAGASAPVESRGGVNPKQVGLGSTMAAIDTIHTGGNLQSTGRLLDLAISGDGYFIVAEGMDVTTVAATATPSQTAGTSGNMTVSAPAAYTGSAGTWTITYQSTGGYSLDKGDGTVQTINFTGTPPTTAAIDGLTLSFAGTPVSGDAWEIALTEAKTGVNNVSYTRAGNFYMDEEGYLINSEGLYVVGAGADISNINTAVKIRIPTNAKDMTIGGDGTVSYIDANGVLKQAGTIALAKFPNTGGLQKIGNNIFQQTSNSGAPLYHFANQSGLGSIASSTLEMSNVDLSEEFTEMIVAQRAFQANTRIITTSDEVLQELVNLKR